MALTFFYDSQIRRFIVQFIKLLSNFQVQFGQDAQGNVTLQRVPVKYGDGSRQAQQVLSGNSENSMPPVPLISCYVSALTYNREWLQSPTFISKMHIRQREWNQDIGDFTHNQGNAFTVERPMPSPYKLGMKVDIWTSNTEQKLQLLEQILSLFNPSIEIQSTDNYIDWTSLSTVALTDVSWTNRSIPVGTDTPIDIATLTFEMPIWISMPARVKKLGVIQKIVHGIWDAHGNLDPEKIDEWELLARGYYTPLNYGILYTGGNTLQLLKYEDNVTAENDSIDIPEKIGTKSNWHDLIQMYGKLNAGITQIRLLLSDDITEVVGTVSYNPGDDSLLLFNIDTDTIPANDLTPVSAIIDPLKTGPGAGLPAATVGQRYLLINDVGSYSNTTGPTAWYGTADLVASANDIIEFDGTDWVIAFDSSEDTAIHYCSNLSTNVQYKWTGSRWIKAIVGEYPGGRWSIVI